MSWKSYQHHERNMFVFFILSLAVFMVLLVTSGDALPQDQRSPAADQQRLAQEVRHQLLLLPRYTVFDNLAYRVDGDSVLLTGTVTDPVKKSDAEGAVKGIEGVAKIDDQIKVLPASPMDEQLRRAEFRAIYSFNGLDRYGFQANPSIHIIVDGGHVTLEGVVDNQADKDAAGIRANTVPNVFSVTNNLQVAKSGSSGK
jgi:hyperosmotically inducible protein